MSEDERSSSPSRKLSIVVGSVESSRSIERCLDALSVSCKDVDAEMIVVNAGVDPVVGHCTAKAANAQLITMPQDSLTPRLWSEGIAASSGEVIAILTGHCIVTVPWAQALLSAVERGAAAAGGPLRLAADASHVDAAIFFLRYSAFLERHSNGAVTDIAGDNAAYVRAMLPAGSWSRESGFWELDVNRAIVQRGDTIIWSDEAAVEFARSFAFASICRHRYAHGRLFGASRAAGGESRMKIVVASPLVPFALAVRIGRRVMRIARYRVRFLLVLPLILVLAACWAFGEAIGAMDTSVANRS